MKITTTLMLFVWAGLLMGACKSAETMTDEAPKTMEQQLIDQHIAAQGGLEAIRAVESLRTTGELYMPVMGMTMPLTIVQQRPSNMRVDVSIEAMGAEVSNGYDGETAWANNPMQGGLQKVTGDQARSIKEQADMDGILVDYADKGYSVEYVGDEDVKGAPAKKMKVIRADSSEAFVFLDAESLLMVKTEAQGTNPMTGAQTKVETYLSDFHEVDGVQRPFLMDVHFGGEPFQTITVKEIETNVEVEEGIFAYPGN